MKTHVLLDFVSRLEITQGRVAGQRFTVLPWQRRFVRGAFRDGVSSAALSVARGNGKTTLVAVAALVGPLAQARNAVTFPVGLHDRARDGWEALLAIGQVAGADWDGDTGLAYRACEHITADSGGDDNGVREMLLADLRAIFQEAGDPEALQTKQILDELHGLDQRPWNEWRRGKPLSDQGLARLLRPFKALTSRTIRFVT